MTTGAELTCGFCERSRPAVRNMVQSRTGAVICNECVAEAAVRFLGVDWVPPAPTAEEIQDCIELAEACQR